MLNCLKCNFCSKVSHNAVQTYEGEPLPYQYHCTKHQVGWYICVSSVPEYHVFVVDCTRFRTGGKVNLVPKCPNCITCIHCSKHTTIIGMNGKDHYTCSKGDYRSDSFVRAQTDVRIKIYCSKFEKIRVPDVECKMCSKKFFELPKGYCAPCAHKLQEAEKLLAQFKQPQPKLKPKPKIGQRKIQTDA